MHGLAFAALLGQLDLSRRSLITELLGFNLGIELTQLIVVALVMPSLIVLSRSRAYPVVRTALAGLGIVLASGWLAQRTTVLDTDPLGGIAETLVEHPWAVPAVLALAAAAVLSAQLRRTAVAVAGWGRKSLLFSPRAQPTFRTTGPSPSGPDRTDSARSGPEVKPGALASRGRCGRGRGGKVVAAAEALHPGPDEQAHL
jgi:hypothetical protein